MGITGTEELDSALPCVIKIRPMEIVSPAQEASAEKPPRWKRRKESRPQELLDAALSLFAQHGYAQTRLDDVASLAGVSKGTVYLYFASKQDLFEAVVHAQAHPWLSALSRKRELSEDQPTEQVLREFLMWGWSQFLASKLYLIARVVLAESNNFPLLAKAYLKEVMGPIHQHLYYLLERGIERGDVAGEVSRERVKAMLAPLSWFSLWRHALLAHGEPPISEERFIREAIHMIVGSVARR
jgi:AcrR family transcriptional regulator